MSKRSRHPTVAAIFKDGVFRPLSLEWAKSFFTEGTTYFLKVEKERHWPGHQAFMAFIREAWRSLPESVREEYPNEDFFRYRLLIASGYSIRRTYVCRNESDAIRMAQAISDLVPAGEHEYRLMSIVVNEETTSAVLVVETAQSQAMDAMDSDTFWESVEAVENNLATMFGVTRETIAEFKQARQQEVC